MLVSPSASNHATGMACLACWLSGQAPPSLPRRSQPEGVDPRHAAAGQEVDDRADTLAALQLHTAQLATEPSIEVAQRAVALSVAVIHHPTGGKGVHLFDHPSEGTVPAIATGDLAQAILGAGQTFAPDAKRASFAQTVAEELAFPDRGDGALLPVDLEPEPVLQERRHRRHHPLARRLRPHVDVAGGGRAGDGVGDVV